jgi:hypothetical protein
MTRKLAISAGALCLLLATIPLAYAQREEPQRDQGRPEQGQQREQKPPQQEHQPPAPPSRPQQSYGGAYHGGVQPGEVTHGGVHPSGVPQHQEEVRSGFQQSRAGSWQREHRTWKQRGGYNGYRIPQARFVQYFGPSHFFHIGGLPLVYVGGYPRFQYDGYWVTFMDPWPESWSPDWYETDNVYLNYTNDGYYLYDTNRPGVGIAVTISF